MRQPAAKEGDLVLAMDTHIVLVPAPPPPKWLPLPHPFEGKIDDALSPNVYIMGKPAATAGSTAKNKANGGQGHIPAPTSTKFQKAPHNTATIKAGSTRVFINGKVAARNGDKASTCNDPADQPRGKLVAAGTVVIG